MNPGVAIFNKYWELMCLPQFIFKELDLEITDFENFTRPFASIKHSPKKNIKKVINDSYSKKMWEKLSSFNETSKLYIYSKIKSELNLKTIYYSSLTSKWDNYLQNLEWV